MVKFAAIPEAISHGDLFFCFACEAWTANRAVLNPDDTWRGIACCDNEEHGAIALAIHAECDDGDEGPFYDNWPGWNV